MPPVLPGTIMALTQAGAEPRHPSGAVPVRKPIREGKRNVTFWYRYEKADWIVFYRHYLCNVWRSRKPHLRTIITFVVVAALFPIWAVRSRELEIALLLVLPAAIAGAAPFFPQIWEHYLTNCFDATVAHLANAKKFATQTMTLTPESIHAVAPEIEAKTAWGRCVRADRTNKPIFVYAVR